MVKFIGMIGLLTLLASIVAFITGFGLSTIMTSILTFVLPLNVIIVLIAPIHLAHSLWKVVLYLTYIDWKITIIFGLPAMLASYWGASLIHYIYRDYFSSMLGLFLMVYAFILWFKPSFRLDSSYSLLIIVGLITGFSAGIFGVRGAIRAVALSAYNLKKEVYIATTGMISLFVDIIRTFAYWWSGSFEALDTSLRLGLIIFILISFLGATIGRFIVEYIPQRTFRLIVAAFIFIVGVKLLL